MLGDRQDRSLAIPWSLILLGAWVCIWLPAQAHARLTPRRSALTQKRDADARNMPIQNTERPHEMVKVHSFRVACAVTSRFAHTVMTSKAQNKANVSKEIFFEVELPKTALISNFSMEIEGRVYVADVKGKEKARKQYEKAVSSGKTAGLVKASGRTMEKFSVSVNIAAKSNVTFVLTYEELLQRKFNQYELLTRVTPKQPVQDFQIVIDIYEPQGIAFVGATGSFLTNELSSLVEKTVMDTKAHISFSPTLEQQRKCQGCEDTIINGDFVVQYDVNRGESLGEIQIVNGYFVHFFAPPDLPRVPKNVVFAVDRSGSMAGAKIAQTREALIAILKELHEDDHFAIIEFDNKVDRWRDSLTKAEEAEVKEAIAHVMKIKDKGATDINQALLSAVSMLVTDREQQRLPERSVDMIILLTDGMPNSGVSNLATIQANVLSAVGGKMSLFCLGFGNDVDYSFLDVMSKQNQGLARRIFEASDAAIQLQGFYEEVSSPLLSNVNLRYPGDKVNFLTKNYHNYLFNGSEIVVAGQLTDNDLDNFLVEVVAKGPDADFRVQGKARIANWDVIYPEQGYIFGDFTERLWAYLTIQQLLENSDVGDTQEKALNMSLQYSFVTPLTSMVVTKPETEDGGDGPLIADKLTEDERQKAERHRGSSSRPLSRPRQRPADVDGDPHFMIELPERNEALCFNINDKPGTIFNLVRDPKSGFVVNGQIIGKKMKASPDGKINTYFAKFGIAHWAHGVRLEVSTQEISVLFQDGRRVKLLWSDTTSFKGTNMDLKLTKHCSLTITLRHSVKFMVVRHTKVWKRRHDQQHYLGFYTLDSHHLSPSVGGLLGQFYHNIEFEVTDLRPGGAKQKLDATLYVNGHTLNVTRHWQKDYSRDVKNGAEIPCWFVDNDGRGLIRGKASDYVVLGLVESF